MASNLQVNTGQNSGIFTLIPQEDISKKQKFLANLQSKNKYKRCVSSPLRYAGGKSLAVGYIIEQIPEDVTKIVSPFFGGGSVEIACAKFLGIDVIGYDIFNILVNYWQQQINNANNLANALAKWQPTKTQYNNVKERLKKHWQQQDLLAPLELASHYYFNHNLSYGPGFLGWMSSIYQNEKRYQSLLARVRNFNTEGNITVKQASFENSIPNHQKDFLYLDPPYYLEGDSKMFRGIYPQRNFPIHHNNFNHQKLFELLQQHKGGFILSYNDCETVREIYRDYKIIEVAWQYTMGQGETRIGKNRKNDDRGHIKKSHEILITC